ncbi:MAG: Smr/MutS family protein [Candidatus Lokiarchaeota archaeon]
MKCDLHGFNLKDAIEEIMESIELCHLLGDNYLLLIHGYRRGQVLKNYIRSKNFLDDMKEKGFNVKPSKFSNPGASQFKIG